MEDDFDTADLKADGAADGPTSTAGGSDSEGEETGAAAAARRAGKHILQTFVFSATLTLPMSLKKRLRKGGGGSGAQRHGFEF